MKCQSEWNFGNVIALVLKTAKVSRNDAKSVLETSNLKWWQNISEAQNNNRFSDKKLTIECQVRQMNTVRIQ